MNSDILYFNIRSKECTSIDGLSTNIQVNLPFPINIPDNKHLEIEVVSAEIPISFYNISSDLQNNSFSYTKIPTGTVNLTISNGQYTVDDLITTINGLQSDFTMSYSDIFNKFLITLKSPITSITFTYNINNYWQQLYGITSSQTITTPAYLSGCVNLASVHSLLMRSSLANGNSASTAQSNNDVIAKISLDGNYGYMAILNQNSYTRKNILSTGNISSFYLKITDQNQRTINLNGLVWECTIVFTLINEEDFQRRSIQEMQQQQQSQLPPVPMPVFSGGGSSSGSFIPQIVQPSEPLQIEETNKDLKNSIKETQPDKIETVQPTDNSKYDAMTDLLYELMI
jgi:PKD repeat protein